MSRCYWLPVIVVVGLVLGNQTPCAQGIPGPAPSPEKQTSQGAGQSKQEPFRLPVIIFETPEQAMADQRRQAESDKHDAADLDAQKRAAQAAEEQVFPSWLGTILGALGTALLIWTLFETRKSTRTARDAANSAEKTLHSTRAWLMHESVDAGRNKNGGLLMPDGSITPVKDGLIFFLKWRNWGATPAIEMMQFFDCRLIDADAPIPLFVPDWPKNSTNIPPGSPFGFHPITLNDADSADVRAGRKVPIVYGAVRYKDIFESHFRISETCLQAVHRGVPWKLVVLSRKPSNLGMSGNRI